MISKAQVQTIEDKTVISGMCWYTSDQYGLLLTVGGVGDISQTGKGVTLKHDGTASNR